MSSYWVCSSWIYLHCTLMLCAGFQFPRALSLLRQPHGFEGLRTVSEGLPRDDLAFSHPHEPSRCVDVKYDSAGSSTGMPVPEGEHPVAKVAELVVVGLEHFPVRKDRVEPRSESDVAFVYLTVQRRHDRSELRVFSPDRDHPLDIP